MRETLSVSHAEDHPSTRRDFLYYATGGVGAVATGAAVWPLVNQMNPSADVQAASTKRVDVSGLAPGTQLTVLFLGKPVFIRRRTEEEIAQGRAEDGDITVDTNARNPNLGDNASSDDTNRTLADFSGENTGEWLVMQGVCTHLGCVPLGDGAGDFGGWFCPCHGSHYDTAGRIRRGPAPENLHIPVAEFVDETTILLG
jgi:ubiquinol-cytochrome c reductase iron-sulfur subunit